MTDPSLKHAREKIERQVEEHEGDAVRHEKEEASVMEATRLSARLIYEVVRRDGEEELRRPLPSLIFSGVAAGILISLSVLGEAILRTYLDAEQPSTFLIENMGYTLGFIVVIFGRMQLFTENTITTVLPVIARPDRECISFMLQLWSVVLAANVIGAFIAAGFLGLTNVLDPDLRASVTELSLHATGFPPFEGFIRSIPAGVLIAAVVWMMPSARGNAFFIIFTFTYLIAAGDFPHIVAGSVEMAFLMLRGDLGMVPALLQFFLPVFAGNVVGGTVIFTLLAWGQVRNEVDHGTGSGTAL
jgi:formate/nitrite transporter FocA (FNT family)